MNCNHPIDRAAKLLGLNTQSLGNLLGVTKGAISQWKLPDRSVPVMHCVAIESATDGQVTRQDLRPTDYWLIWPELKKPEEVA